MQSSNNRLPGGNKPPEQQYSLSQNAQYTPLSSLLSLITLFFHSVSYFKRSVIFTVCPFLTYTWL